MIGSRRLVLPIGGVKEKAQVARPAPTRKTSAICRKTSRKEMEFIFADRVRDVFTDMFPGAVPEVPVYIGPAAPPKAA